MSTREKLNHSFEITRRLVHKFADGLSNVDSLAAIYDSERRKRCLSESRVFTGTKRITWGSWKFCVK